MLPVKLSAIVPETPLADAVVTCGFEPWHLPALFQGLGRAKLLSHEMLDAARKLEASGLSGLSEEQLAFWYSYERAAERPLPPPGAGLVDVDEAAVRVHVRAFKAAKADVERYRDACARVASSLVLRTWNVGIFASRGPVCLTTLPPWVRGAVLVDTRRPAWELVVVGHSVYMSLPAWCTAALKEEGEFSGHRMRVRREGLPSMRGLHFAVSGLWGALDESLDVRRRPQARSLHSSTPDSTPQMG